MPKTTRPALVPDLQIPGHLLQRGDGRKYGKIGGLGIRRGGDIAGQGPYLPEKPPHDYLVLIVLYIGVRDYPHPRLLARRDGQDRRNIDVFLGNARQPRWQGRQRPQTAS